MIRLLSMGIALLPTLALSYRPPVALRLALEASSIVGGNAVNASITLTAAAPAGGAIVTVTNPAGTTIQAGANQSGLQQIGLTHIQIPAGQQTVSFRVNTAGVATNTVATLTATLGGELAAATLVITPARPRSVVVPRGVVTGGTSVVATVILDGAAPLGGVDVPVFVAQAGLAADGGAAPPATPPEGPASAIAHFSIGASSTTVTVATTPVARNASRAIIATLGGISASGVLVVRPPTVTTVQLAPAIVIAPNASTGTVNLSGPAPFGFNVLLSASNSSASVPSQVTVPAGATSATFPITTAPPSTGSTAVVIISAQVTSTATTSGPSAPTITDGSSNTIQAGEAPGASAALTVQQPVVVQSTSVSPSTVTGGAPITLAINVGYAGTSSGVSFSGPTTIVAGTAQITVDQPSAVQLPSSVSIPAHAGVITVNGTTTALTADVTVNIHTTFGSTTVSSAVLVKAPIPPLESFSLRPTTVVGGTNTIASLRLSPSVTHATLVTLSSNRPDLIQLPKSVTVPANGVPLALTLPTSAVSVKTAITITAAAGAQKLEFELLLVP